MSVTPDQIEWRADGLTVTWAHADNTVRLGAAEMTRDTVAAITAALDWAENFTPDKPEIEVVVEDDPDSSWTWGRGQTTVPRSAS